jgi:ABC-type multidrug transport system ATPase subunit
MTDVLEEVESHKSPIIRLIDVEIGYKAAEPLVKIPNLEVYPGEIVAIAGPSGVGKTTLLRTIAGLIRPISGKLEVCGLVSPFKPGKGVLGYVPQRLGLIRHTSVIHNVMIGANAGHNKSFWSLLPSSLAKKHALESIDSMGLSDKLNEPVRRLSGGQQRRVATARTLAQEPVLILADEFLSELDDETMAVVLKRVVEYIRNNNAALLVVEHDISRAKSMADRLLVIDDGRINPFITEVTMIEVKV